VQIAEADSDQNIRVLFNRHEVRYYWSDGSNLIAIDPHEPHVLRAVYMILAEMAKEAERSLVES
jgi:hypothetical protein